MLELLSLSGRQVILKSIMCYEHQIFKHLYVNLNIGINIARTYHISVKLGPAFALQVDYHFTPYLKFQVPSHQICAH
jgi:hypothetical protein